MCKNSLCMHANETTFSYDTLDQTEHLETEHLRENDRHLAVIWQHYNTKPASIYFMYFLSLCLSSYNTSMRRSHTCNTKAHECIKLSINLQEMLITSNQDYYFLKVSSSTFRERYFIKTKILHHGLEKLNKRLL